MAQRRASSHCKPPTTCIPTSAEAGRLSSWRNHTLLRRAAQRVTLLKPLIKRRAPKVTVTRGRVSLCQKGVTWWLLFLVNCLWVRKPAKTSRGASFELLARAPLRSKTDALPWRGDRGEVGWAELFTMAAPLR